MKGEGTFKHIIAVVRRVPRGRVASYGQIARLAGPRCHARLVGYALAALPEGSRVPWQRIVNRAGRVSLPGPSGDLQRQLLEAEGVRFDSQDRIDLARHGWLSARTAPRRGGSARRRS
jgi:methylated-DNA-protein-cysteine methyltransferase related protein